MKYLYTVWQLDLTILAYVDCDDYTKEAGNLHFQMYA